jgi:hypothetical protein
VPVLQERVRLIAQHGDPVLGDSAQLPLAYSVTH